MGETCAHTATSPWRAGKWEPDGRHGPEMTTSVAGERLARSWATCLACGVRVERVRVVGKRE